MCDTMYTETCKAYQEGYKDGIQKALETLESYHLNRYRNARRNYGERMREGNEWASNYHIRWSKIHSFVLWSVRYDMDKNIESPACHRWSSL